MNLDTYGMADILPPPAVAGDVHAWLVWGALATAGAVAVLLLTLIRRSRRWRLWCLRRDLVRGRMTPRSIAHHLARELDHHGPGQAGLRLRLDTLRFARREPSASQVRLLLTELFR